MSKTILSIEDDPAVSRALKRYLERMGYMVHETSSLGEAHGFMTSTPELIDVIVADTNLGDGDSPNLHSALIDIMITHKIGWVSVTGGASGYQRQYFARHNVTVLEKPILEIEELTTAIEAAYKRG